MKPTELSPEQWRILGSSGVVSYYKCATINTQRLYDWGMGIFVGFCVGIITAVTITEILKGLV